MTLPIGAKAPLFTLANQDGKTVSLKDYAGKQPLVLFFYPRDDTRVCTMEARGFRDDYQSFKDAGVAVIGISSDDVASHASFCTKLNLNYDLLSDPAEEVRRAFGVKKTLGILPGRVTFVLDKDLSVRHVCDAAFSAEKHVTEALAAARRL